MPLGKFKYTHTYTHAHAHTHTRVYLKYKAAEGELHTPSSLPPPRYPYERVPSGKAKDTPTPKHFLSADAMKPADMSTPISKPALSADAMKPADMSTPTPKPGLSEDATKPADISAPVSPPLSTTSSKPWGEANSRPSFKSSPSIKQQQYSEDLDGPPPLARTPSYARPTTAYQVRLAALLASSTFSSGFWCSFGANKRKQHSAC